MNMIPEAPEITSLTMISGWLVLASKKEKLTKTSIGYDLRDRETNILKKEIRLHAVAMANYDGFSQ